ncbi:uncharacterized protein DMENIID0001_014600 [Sergentomyia squamirostris]
MFSRNLRRIVTLCKNLNDTRSVTLGFSRNLREIPPVAGCVKIHTSAVDFGKIFPEKENDYAHGILQRVGKYNLMKDDANSPGELLTQQEFDVISGRKDWKETPLNELIGTFERLAVFCGKNDVKISDERLDDFMGAMVQRCGDFTDEQLLKSLRMLTHFPPAEGLNTRNFVELWSSLDDACVERVDKWKTDELLLVCDHWYALNLAKVCKCTFQCTKKLGRKLKSLSPTDLVQTMFYVNMCRKPMVDMFNFEVNLFENIDKLSLDEIAVMSMGFFKTETKIRNPELIDKIYQRVIAEMKTVQDISLVNIMKVLRYSSKLQHIEFLEEFLKAVTPEISRLSILSCLHVALFGTDMQYYNQECLERIVDRFVNEVKSCRLKEFERLSFVMGLYSFTMSNGNHTKLCQQIIAELPNRISEIMKHPRCFPACLHYLTLCGHHSAEQISTVLDMKYFEMAYGRNYLACREILCLDTYARINLRDSYKGNLMPEKIRKTLAKIHSNYIPAKDQKYKLSAADMILLEIKDTCDELFGCNSPSINHLLPQYERPDIIFAINRKSGESVSLQQNYPPPYSGDILTRELLLQDIASAEDLDVFVIVVGGWNILVRSTNTMTGQLKLKMQQLQLIGLKPIMIPWFAWRKLRLEERPVYLKAAIKEATASTES